MRKTKDFDPLTTRLLTDLHVSPKWGVFPPQEVESAEPNQWSTHSLIRPGVMTDAGVHSMAQWTMSGSWREFA